jgi:hypothetical protein
MPVPNEFIEQPQAQLPNSLNFDQFIYSIGFIAFEIYNEEIQ